jgi:hypothetical protein
MEMLRRAEQDGKKLAQNGVEKLGEKVDDAQSAMRRRMRVRPDRRKDSRPAAEAPRQGEMTPPVPLQTAPARRGGRRPIVSINGRDVNEEELKRASRPRKIA